MLPQPQNLPNEILNRQLLAGDDGFDWIFDHVEFNADGSRRVMWHPVRFIEDQAVRAFRISFVTAHRKEMGDLEWSLAIGSDDDWRATRDLGLTWSEHCSRAHRRAQTESDKRLHRYRSEIRPHIVAACGPEVAQVGDTLLYDLAWTRIINAWHGAGHSEAATEFERILAHGLHGEPREAFLLKQSGNRAEVLADHRDAVDALLTRIPAPPKRVTVRRSTPSRKAPHVMPDHITTVEELLAWYDVLDAAGELVPDDVPEPAAVQPAVQVVQPRVADPTSRLAGKRFSRGWGTRAATAQT